MKSGKLSTLINLVFALILIAGLLVGCTPTPTENETEADSSEETSSEATNAETEDIEADEAEAEVEEADAETEGEETESTEAEETGEPQSGGKLILAGWPEPATLDPALNKSASTVDFLGASLTILNPEGEIVPYLAASWEYNEEDISWTFHLREDVVFSDGTPLKASDFAWTYNRALDPETMSPILPMLLGDVKSIEATDDYTLVITLNTPNSGLLFNLSFAGYAMPMSQAAFESGIDYQREHVGVGPYLLKEWVTGDHITYVRNPNFTWGPEFTHQGPAYIEELEFRFIPEYATIIAGLEAGEIHISDMVQSQDIPHLTELGEFTIAEQITFGFWPGIFLNATIAPFDDQNIRQALSYALDRQSIQNIVYSGNGEIISGPLNSGTFGYWSGIEEYGYNFDLDKVDELMTASGYAKNADGYWEINGETFSFNMMIAPMDDLFRKVGEIAQEQWKQAGFDCEIQINENLFNELLAGNYGVALSGLDWPDGGELLYMVYHSDSLNIKQTEDETLDQLLLEIKTATNLDARQEATNQAAIYITEQAYTITMVAKPSFWVYSSNLQGVLINKAGIIKLFDAYFTE